MTVYLGKNPVGVGRIVEKKVAKEKFGATVDSFLGNVDANGNYVAPSEPVEVNLAGVKHIGSNQFNYKFYSVPITKFSADSLVTIPYRGLIYAFGRCSNLLEASFGALEEVTEEEALQYAFYSCNKSLQVSFPKLRVVSGNSSFANCFYGTLSSIDEDMFPALEEVTGSGAFKAFIDFTSSSVIKFPKLKKIVGGANTYYPLFSNIYTSGIKWYFPNATEFSKTIWSSGASYTGEIHFAAANQAAIEACDGYANKWGFAGATIYFDL